MRALSFAVLLVLSACGDVRDPNEKRDGRYQIAPSTIWNSVWRVDTRTGEVAICTFDHFDGQKHRVRCRVVEGEPL